MAQRMMPTIRATSRPTTPSTRINYQPKDLSSALDRLEAPYLPLVIQEAAGLPLDPSSPSRRRSWTAATALFFQCAGGAEARRFNRLLIDAGLIKGMVSR